MPRLLRVLIVEDNPIILDGLSELLAELPHVEVVGSVRAHDATLWMDGRTQACDVALIDNFEASSGLEALAHATSYEHAPACILLTDYATVDMRKRCAALGAAAVFDRSTEVEELIQWLEIRSQLNWARF